MNKTRNICYVDPSTALYHRPETRAALALHRTAVESSIHGITYVLLTFLSSFIESTNMTNRLRRRTTYM
jgi:hypothetical protein